MTSSPLEDSRDSVLRHTTDNGVSWITLSRPAAMNAITPDQREHLISLLDHASADPAVRAVVLTATGKGFCAGADLRGTSDGAERIAGDVARHFPVGETERQRGVVWNARSIFVAASVSGKNNERALPDDPAQHLVQQPHI